MTTVRPEVISGRVIISTLGGPEKPVPQLMTFAQTGLINHISNKVITNGTLGSIGGAKKTTKHSKYSKTKTLFQKKLSKKTKRKAKHSKHNECHSLGNKFVEVGNEKFQMEKNDGGEIEAATAFMAVERIVQRGIVNALNSLKKNNGGFKNFSNKKYSMLIEVAEVDEKHQKMDVIPFKVDIMMSPINGFVGYKITQV